MVKNIKEAIVCLRRSLGCKIAHKANQVHLLVCVSIVCGTAINLLPVTKFHAGSDSELSQNIFCAGNVVSYFCVKKVMYFLISKFHHVLNLVCFLLGDSPASTV
jgi:hypothetical protein